MRWRSSMATSASPTRQWYRAHLGAGRGLRRAGARGRRPSRHACCRTAGRRRPCTGPASSPASSSRRSTGAPRPTSSTTCSTERRGQGAGLRGRRRRDAVAASQGGAAPSAHLGRRARTTSRSIALVSDRAPDVAPRADAEAWSVMLYTSGTTAKPKGVPRRQRAERAAALAHVAQNLYRNGERTLGVMPLYHTMGVRSLLAMSLIGGTFVCLPRFDVAQRAGADRGGEGHQPLSGADALSRPGASRRASSRTDVSLGAQARLRRRLDDRRAAQEAARRRSSRSCSSITTARRKSTPSPSTRTRRRSPARPAAPASTRWCAW